MKRVWILFWSVLFVAGFFTNGIVFSFFVPRFWAVVSVLGGIFGALIIAFFLVYFWWAPNNLFFTFVKEGTAKIVVRGDAVKRVLIQWRGHRLARAGPPDQEGDVIKDADARNRWLGGFRWYGLWPLDDIYIYLFSWTNITQSGEIQKHSKEGLDFILLKDDVYWAQVGAAEDINLLPLDVGIVLRLRVANPYKALFAVQNWLETIINMVEPAVRDVLTTKSYEDWIKMTENLGDVVFARLQEGGAGAVISQIRSRYGVEMISFGVKTIDPSPFESLGEARKATLKQYLADQDKKRIVTEAAAEKARITAVYQPIHDFGEVGKLVRGFEAFEKALSGPGTKMLAGGMADFLSAIFPGRAPESLRSDEIRALRDALQRLAPAPAPAPAPTPTPGPPAASS